MPVSDSASVMVAVPTVISFTTVSNILQLLSSLLSYVYFPTHPVKTGDGAYSSVFLNLSNGHNTVSRLVVTLTIKIFLISIILLLL